MEKTHGIYPMIHSYPTFSHMNEALSHGFPMVFTYVTTGSPWPFLSRKDSQTCRATRLAALHWNSDVIIVIIAHHMGEWCMIYYNALFLYMNVTVTLLFISLFKCYLSPTNMIIIIWSYGWNLPLPHGIMMRPAQATRLLHGLATCLRRRSKTSEGQLLPQKHSCSYFVLEIARSRIGFVMCRNLLELLLQLRILKELA